MGRFLGEPQLAVGPVAVIDTGWRVTEAAAAGDGRTALEGLGAMRVLCAHRRGPYGVATWTGHVERWLTAAIDGYGAGGRWYVGRPLLVTENVLWVATVQRGHGRRRDDGGWWRQRRV